MNRNRRRGLTEAAGLLASASLWPARAALPATPWPNAPIRILLV